MNSKQAFLLIFFVLLSIITLNTVIMVHNLPGEGGTLVTEKDLKLQIVCLNRVQYWYQNNSSTNAPTALAIKMDPVTRTPTVC